MLLTLQYFSFSLKLEAQSNALLKSSWSSSFYYFFCSSLSNVNTEVSWQQNLKPRDYQSFRHGVSLKSSFYQRFNLNSSFSFELYRRNLWRTWPALHHSNTYKKRIFFFSSDPMGDVVHPQCTFPGTDTADDT